ncbi:hypothetical protein [Halostella salina]|uniref:hypothetical protein n=1 Tax=Halostella salina TaxID=1547897 RepID=UPI0013CEA700|nr:hypothetical protein [Halostella salina]
MSTLLDAVRRPEHTGDRRCWPCTAVNGLLLAVASVGVAVVSPPAAAAVAVVGAAAIAVRGYLVPYTPQFAPKLVAALPVDPFHGGDAGEAPGADGTSDALAGEEDDDGSGAAGEDVLAALVDAGVVVPDGETLYLDESFREAWRAEVETLRGMNEDALAAAAADAAPAAEEARVERVGSRRYVIIDPGTGSAVDERQLTVPVALASVGAARALADRVDDPAVRSAAAEPLRTFLERCPACDGPVEETTETRCCGGPRDPTGGPADVLACADCEERLYTF